MNLGPGEIILIIVALVLLFGAKKLPDLSRSVGRSLRIFKSETAKLRDDDDDVDKATVVQAEAQPAKPAAQPQQIPATAPVSAEDQAALLEAQAARLRAEAVNKNNA